MIRISKRFLERAKTSLRRYQKVLDSARSRDVNESDTVVIVTDFLAEVLGYDKYTEITTEFAVRSTFCDIAIQIEGELHYLVEIKSAGTDLRDNHLRQAVDYAANQGIEAIILTNGFTWEVHRVRSDQPTSHDLVLSIDLLDPACKPAQLLQQLFLISREASGGTEMEKFWRHKQATSRYVLAQLLLSQPLVKAIRRELRGVAPGISVSLEQIEELLRAEVLKRDALEGDRAEAATKLVRRSLRRR